MFIYLSQSVACSPDLHIVYYWYDSPGMLFIWSLLDIAIALLHTISFPSSLCVCQQLQRPLISCKAYGVVEICSSRSHDVGNRHFSLFTGGFRIFKGRGRAYVKLPLLGGGGV